MGDGVFGCQLAGPHDLFRLEAMNNEHGVVVTPLLI